MKVSNLLKFPFSIRIKVILPYLLLTLLVAITGAYVVTRLVANSLSERLTNQLLESGRAVSDGMARKEIEHLEIARLIAFTRGFAEALNAGDTELVTQLIQPAAIGLGAENLILVNADGKEIFHLLEQGEENYSLITEDTGAGGLINVQKLLRLRNPNDTPKRSLAVHPINQRYYYFTAIPVVLNGEVTGVVVVGTSLDSLIVELKSSALADVTFYGDDGKAIYTSMNWLGSEQELLSSLSLNAETYSQVLANSGTVTGKGLSLLDKQYSLAWGPLRIGNEKIGAFAVALPMNFVLQAGTTSRNTYAFVFTLAMMGVVGIGYGVARIITRPLNMLVETSQAIAEGDLNQRTNIRSSDEIGILAVNFDEMTDKLSQRTRELEKAYQALEQMDRTKISFIDVAAHELRTPLTLVKGYTQMLVSKGSSDASLAPLAQGILNGTNRMLEVVSSMLDVSRIDSQTLKVIPELLEIGPIITLVSQEFHKAIEERKLNYRVEDLSTLPAIQADPDLLHKLFYHLIVNAIKYTPDGGSIQIHGREIQEPGSPAEIEIVIQDSGIGIDRQHHELVFEKFFQTGEVLFHSSGKTKYKGGGPGLGLAIARGIVQAHGGKIWVESPGHDEINFPGSRFYVRLPQHGVIS